MNTLQSFVNNVVYSFKNVGLIAALVGVLSGSSALQSCDTKNITPTTQDSTNVIKKLKPYDSIIASHVELGTCSAYIDPQGTMIPTTINLKINAQTGVIESKLRNVINRDFTLAIEKHGGPFSTVQEFLDFADQNSSLFQCDLGVSVQAFDGVKGNSGGGIINISSFKSFSSGLNIDPIDVLKIANDKLVNEGKPGFLVEVGNSSLGKKVLSTKSGARISLHFAVTDTTYGSKGFFNLYFNPDGIQLLPSEDSQVIDIPYTIK